MASDYKVFRGTDLVGVFGVLELDEAIKTGRVLDDDFFITEGMTGPLRIQVLKDETEESEPPAPTIRPMRRFIASIGTVVLVLLWVSGAILLLPAVPGLEISSCRW